MTSKHKNHRPLRWRDPLLREQPGDAPFLERKALRRLHKKRKRKRKA